MYYFESGGVLDPRPPLLKPKNNTMQLTQVKVHIIVAHAKHVKNIQ